MENAQQLRYSRSTGRIEDAAAAVLRVQVCSHWDELEILRQEWEHLIDLNPSLTIFSTPEWLGAWWKVHGEKRRLFSPVFFDGSGELIGILPLCISTEPAMGILQLRRLMFVGANSGDSDNLDAVVRPGRESACADGFLRWLRETSAWDICSLDTLPDDSRFATELKARTKSERWRVCQSSVPKFSIELPSSWEAYLEQLNPNFRPLLTRYPKRLQTRYSTRIYRVERTEELDNLLNAMFELHQKRRERLGQHGAFASAERRRFYFEMAHAFLKRGWLQFWIMELNGKIAAAQFCFQHRNTVYLLQEGFDPNYAQDKVGYALRARMLQQCIDAGVRRYDFLGGDDTYKAKFGAKQGRYLNLRFARAGTVASFVLLAKTRLHESRMWLRTRIPAPIGAVLRMARKSLRLS